MGKLCTFILLFILLSSGFAGMPVNAADLKPVILQLRWDHQFQFAGYYAADWKGYYREEGLNAEIRSAVTRDGKILSATQEVSSGRADFGIGGADILIACDQGADLRVVSVIFQNSAAHFYLKQETPYSSLSDLTNLRVARRVNDLIDVELQAMLLSEGIDPRKIFPHPHQSGMEHLLSDRVQVMPGYKTTIPYHAAKSGVSLKEISPITYGIDFYGDSIFASGHFVSRNPDTVAGFVRASLKGWDYALRHPEEIAAKISTRLERVEEVKDIASFNLFQARVIGELTLYPLVELGHINPARWEKMHHFLKRLGLVKKEADMNTFIFDPKKIQSEREACFRKMFRWVFALTLITTLLISLWAWSLRKSVCQKTAQLQNELALRKETEKNLRDREMLLRKVSENLPRSCITVIEKDFTISFISGREFQEQHRDSDDFAGMPIAEMFEEHTQSVEQHYRKTFAGEDTTFELFLSNRYYIYNTVPLFEDNGEIQRILCVARNVTDRRQMENALRESEQQLKKILEILPVGVWIADRNGTITMGNPAGKEIWKGARYVGPERFHEYKPWRVKNGKRILPEEWGLARAVFKGESSMDEEIELDTAL